MGNAASSAVEVAQSQYQQLVTKAKVKIDEKIDEATMSAAAKVLSAVGKEFKNMAPPYLPPELEDKWDKVTTKVWETFEEEQLRILRRKYGRSGNLGEFREMRVLFWPSKHPSGCSFKSVRARILYALAPGDSNIFKVLQDARRLENSGIISLILLLARICPFWGLSVFVFCLKFLLIDRTDEFQLVKYILEFKAFQFISSGLLIGVQLGFTNALCFIKEQNGSHDACLHMAPGQSHEFAFEVEVMEPLRLLLIYSAALLLAQGKAKGGMEALTALENARLDAADGELDGVVDRNALRNWKYEPLADDAPTAEDSSTCPQTLTRESRWIQSKSNSQTDLLEVETMLKEHREALGVQTGEGGYLKYFLVFDLLVLACLLLTIWALCAFDYVRPGWFFASIEDHGAFWAMLYYMKFAYAIMAFPFLVFSLPVWGPIIHGALPTAYDKHGQLVPRLSSAELKEKIKADRDLDALREKGLTVDVEAIAVPSSQASPSADGEPRAGGEASTASTRKRRFFGVTVKPIELMAPFQAPWAREAKKPSSGAALETVETEPSPAEPSAAAIAELDADGAAEASTGAPAAAPLSGDEAPQSEGSQSEAKGDLNA